MLTKKKYISEIDGLRAIAIIAVVINHLNGLYLPNGYLGVDLFFVVSGFVVTKSIFQSEGEFIPSAFYVRRILRLFPASLFCILLSVMFSLFFLFPHMSSSTVKTGSLSILGLGNIYLIKSAQGYFAHATSLNLLTHTWSLAVEEQFYLLFPILLFFFYVKKKSKKEIIYVIIFLTILSIVSNFIISNQDMKYYSLLTRFWQIAFGFLIFCVSEIKVKDKFYFPNLNYIFLALITALFFFNIYTNFLTSILLCVLVSLVLFQISFNQKTNILLDNKLLINIGKMSYSIYLWHWPVFALFRNTIGLEGANQGISLIVIALLSFISYELFEQKFRYLKIINRRKFLSIFFLSAISLSSGIYLLSEQSFFIGKVTSTFSVIDSNSWEKGKCSVSASELIDENYDYFKKCKLVNNDPAKTIYVIGDSYAQQVMPVLYDIASEKKISLVAMAATGCHPISGLQIEREKGEFNCTKRLKSFLNILNRELREGDKVILAFSHSYFLENEIFKHGESYLSQNIARSYLIKEYTLISNLIMAKKADGYILGNIPQLKVEPSLCNQPWSLYRHDCKLNNIIDENLTAKRLEIDNLLANVKFKNLQLISIMDEIKGKIGEVDLYFNPSHLSTTGSKQLKDVITKNLKI